MNQVTDRVASKEKSTSQLLRLQEVASLTALGMSTILAWEKEGRFPRALRLSPGKRLWRESDIDHWIVELAHRDLDR